MHTGYWWESQTEGDHYEEQDEGEELLKIDLREIGWMVWIGVIWLRIGISIGLS
jgi:hypothetical protein